MRITSIALTLVVCSSIEPAAAQPTITQASAPVPGGPPVTHYNSYDPFSIPIGGPVVFDLSGQIAVDKGAWTIESPVGQPGSSNFPDATVVRVSEDETYFEYVSGGPNGFERLGFYMPGPPSTLYACSDPIRDLPYPATYGTTWSDDHTCTGTSGHRDWVADGYGELLFPLGSLTDVLMTSMEVMSAVDTLPGGVLAWLVTNVHNFWHASMGFPAATAVVTIWYEDGIEVDATYNAQHILGVPLSSVEDLTHARRLLISPNPSDGLVTVNGEDLRELMVLDLGGRSVHAAGSIPIDAASGQLDLRSLSPGVYVVRATTRTGLLLQSRLVLY